MAGEAFAALIGGEVGLNLFSGITEYNYAQEEQQIANKQLDQESVQVQLQDTQQAIARDNKLSQIMAHQTVMMGVAYVAPSSGTARALFDKDIFNYDQDNETAKMNLAAKQLTIAYQREAIKRSTEAKEMGIELGTVTNIAKTALAYEGGRLPTGAEASNALGGTTSTANNPFDINSN